MAVLLPKGMQLTRTEVRAWKRWHPHLRVGQVIQMKIFTRARFPLIQGGARG